MHELYPAGPAQVPQDLTVPNPAYKRHAWIAMAALTLFVLLYVALAGWFAFKAYSLFAGAVSGGKNAFLGVLFGLPVAFIAIFLCKALIFLRPGGKMEDLEVTAAQQPKLFEFLNRLADEAGAPRPHRVFLSPRVNAAVFYDLTILNFLFPSKKNLEIGLGLVNALTLSEFKAVLAHEFGHFAQRSMAVGRWVYMAQQIAEHIVWRRDQLDRFLQGLSRSDIRVAWVGWILRLIVWSIRSLLETLFQGVMLAQRALSREMEFQADLVAVSLTGSDALIHALHQAQTADDAWDRTLSFANGELGQGRKVVDLFALQSRVLERMREMLGDPEYARVPAVPSTRPEAHRVFRAELAQPPRMWLTHPHNHEREENAKRVYLPAPTDPRSAWALFTDTAALRSQVSLGMVSGNETEPVPIEDSLKRLDACYAIESLQTRYVGVYLGRSVVRAEMQAHALYADGCSGSAQSLAQLYAPAVSEQLAQWRSLEKEIGLLERVESGEFSAQGGVVHHRERQLPRKQLPQLLTELRAELIASEQPILAHDRACRGEHLAAARRIGGGWAEYLQGLLATLHYAEHAQADLRDAQRFLAREYQVVTADGNVSKGERKRLVKGCAVVYTPLQQIYANVALVQLDDSLLERLKIESWAGAFEEFKLGPADENNLGSWLDVIDGWINVTCRLLGALGDQALEQLLESERRVAQSVIDGSTLPPAPPAARVEADYARLLPRGERKLQRKLGWWDRFQVADGWVPAGARLAVAGGIVGTVIGYGGALGNASLTIYNGLATPVRVIAGTQSRFIAPFQTASLEIPLAPLAIQTTSASGQEIERFETPVDIAFADYVYNVAAASPLIEWTATYGGAQEVPERNLGAVRFSTVSADVLFADPPESISSKGEGGTRSVVVGVSDGGPSAVQAVKTDADGLLAVALAHAQWDDTGSRHAAEWLGIAASTPAFPAVLQARLAAAPDDVLLRRMAQDIAADGDSQACTSDTAAAASAPGKPDLVYLAARCLPTDEARNAAFRAGYAQFPEHAWLAYAAGYDLAQMREWEPAAVALETARSQLVPLADRISLDLERIERVLGRRPDPARTRMLSTGSPRLVSYLEYEALPGYQALQNGEFEAAMTSDASLRARMLRLVAASRDATPAQISEALALEPDAGLDFGTIGAGLGLALREGVAPDALLSALEESSPEEAAMLRAFIQDLPSGDRERLERHVREADLQVRAQAYVLACVALGAGAPTGWKEDAQRLLFADERPLL